MARTVLAILNESGVIEAIELSRAYTQDYVYEVLGRYYNEEEKVRQLINLGDLYSLGIEPKIYCSVYEQAYKDNNMTMCWYNAKDGDEKYFPRTYVNVSLEEFIALNKLEGYAERDIFIYEVEKGAWFYETEYGLLELKKGLLDDINEALGLKEKEESNYDKMSKQVQESIKRCKRFIDESICILWDDKHLLNVSNIKQIGMENYSFPNNLSLLHNGGNIIMMASHNYITGYNSSDDNIEMIGRLKWVRNNLQKQNGKFILYGNKLKCYDMELGKDREGWTRICDVEIDNINVRDSSDVKIEINCRRMHC